MEEKKESIFSKLFKPSKSCCCSMEIVDEDKEKTAEDKEEKEKESK